MIDTDAICQAHGKQEISTIGYVRGENNIADALTNIKYSAPLMKFLLRNKCYLPIEHCVLRS